MTSHHSAGDTGEPVSVFTWWELTDETDNVTPLDADGRKAAFEGWVERMLVKSARWDAARAKEFVVKVIRFGGFTCCFDLHAALDPKTRNLREWVTDYPDKKLKLSDHGVCNLLYTLLSTEVAGMTQTSSRIPTGVVGIQDPMQQMLMMSAALTGGKTSVGGMGLVPGYSQAVSEAKRVRRVRLEQLLKSAKMEKLFDEALPPYKVIESLESSLTAGDEHVQFNINDMVELFDEWLPESDESSEKVRKPPKGEA